jgi:hypothetical protein
LVPRVAYGQHLLGKADKPHFLPLPRHIVSRKISMSHAWLSEPAQVEHWETGMMNPRRFATVAAVLCETAFVAYLAGFSSVGTGRSDAVATDERQSPFLTSDAPQATVISDAVSPLPARAISSATADSLDIATAAESAPATDTAPAPDEPKVIVEAALTEASQTSPPEIVASDERHSPSLTADAPQATAISDAAIPPPAPAISSATADSADIATSPVQVATASTPDALPKATKDAVNTIEIVSECLVADPCIDQYLWAIYQRTPKEDTIKVDEKRKVAVKRKGKTVTVTKTFTRLVDENFGWKDPKAAEKAGIAMMDYVIGGMDRSFKLKLFYVLHAAEEAGLAPGITSAFRDDYRQSIASGLKAASDRSYHGGSSHGGYGHGLAADVVSVKGETRAQRSVSTENLWKWIDAHEKDFGVGRPYLDRDPPHVAPIDGKEYASHRGTKPVHAVSIAKEHKQRKAGLDENVIKRPRTARSSKVRTI